MLIWKDFLQAIRDGVYPEEIRPRYGQEIEVELIDKKGEEYVLHLLLLQISILIFFSYKPPPKDIKAFDGPVLSMGGGKAANAMLAVSKPLVVDASKPSGSIKVRFLDGSMPVIRRL